MTDKMVEAYTMVGGCLTCILKRSWDGILYDVGAKFRSDILKRGVLRSNVGTSVRGQAWMYD